MRHQLFCRLTADGYLRPLDKGHHAARLDDGAKQGHAKIGEYHRVTAGPGDIISFLPRAAL